ncbi:DUF4145 domain-containing protein [Tritonibacter scottomollicae]|uniref:DUF4145 domain-containing protein n=1 Tax=Tritonibacter scottomollicae TaxID=483013 RepID=UPI003BA8BCDC
MSENAALGVCPECQKRVNCSVIAAHEKRWSEYDGEIMYSDMFQILECRGCETAFFCRIQSCSEDYHTFQVGPDEWVDEYINRETYWPSVPRFINNTVNIEHLSRKNQQLSALLEDTIRAANEDMPVFAAIGIRTCFDILSVDLGADTDDSFAEKLETLRKNGYIGGKQKGKLEVLIDAGSAAAHRGWKPSSAQLSTLLNLLTMLIHDTYCIDEEVKKIKSRIPKKGENTKTFGDFDEHLKTKNELLEKFESFPGLSRRE